MLNRLFYALVLFLGLSAPALAQVGMTQTEFEKVNGSPTSSFLTKDQQKGLIYQNVWSNKSGDKFTGRTLIGLDIEDKINVEIFFFEHPLPTDKQNSLSVLGIAANLLPDGLTIQHLGRKTAEWSGGTVLILDCGEGYRVSIYFDKDTTHIVGVGADLTTRTI
jgi:hypothetical protein